MTSLRKNERGFSAVESVLVVIIVVAIVFVGWYIDKHRTKTTKTVAVKSSQQSVSTQPSTPLPSGTSNSDLQSDLSNVTSTSNQSNQDITTSSSSLNDQSTMTTVPQ